MSAAAITPTSPGHGFADFVLLALIIAPIVGMVRDLRAHPEDADENEPTTAMRRNRSGTSETATETPAPSRRRDRARQRARAAFRRFRKHSWLRKKLLPGEHGDPTPSATLADGVAGAFAVFAYAAGFAAGLAHARTAPAPGPTPGTSTGKQTPRPGSPTTGRPAAGSGKSRRQPGSRRRRLADLFRRRPAEGEVVDPESIPEIGTARDADVIDAEILDDTNSTDTTNAPPANPQNTEPRTQGVRTMAFVQTIHELISWAKSALASADTKAVEADMRAKVAVGRSEDAAASAQSAAGDALMLADVYAYWSDSNVDSQSLAAIEDALEAARVVQKNEAFRAEIEASLVGANQQSLASILYYQETVATMAATVKARQMPHAEAQRDTGNAAAAAAVLEGA